MRLAEAFCAEYPHRATDREAKDESLQGDELLAPVDRIGLSRRVATLLEERVPSARVLTSAAELFDLTVTQAWPGDSFGERYEVCSALAFVSWRHASELGLEIESQEWLRVIDALVEEPFTALECIEEFFELGSELQTVKRAQQFLSKPEDVFLALASLRRRRNLDPKGVLRAATIVYLVCVDANDFRDEEKNFFMGEAAWLVGHGGRYLSNRSECRRWLTLAARHFGESLVREPLLAKARLAFSISARDRHEVGIARSAATGLRALFTSWNMNREVLICELVECILKKETGAMKEALAEFQGLIARLREGCVFDLLAAALPPYAEIRFKAGERIAALELLQEATCASAGMPLLECTVFMSFAESHLELGNLSAAILWCQAAVNKAVGAACVAPLAYARVWLADILIRSDRVDDAYRELLLALPLLEAGEMMEEMAYAATLLAQISARRASGTQNDDGSLRNL
ncbi:MAG: hypothetical protein ABI682_07470 [Acidobacteriota bacterium]